LSDINIDTLLTSTNEEQNHSTEKQKTIAPRSLKKDLEDIKNFLLYLQTSI
jgi:hypothetical protein